MATYTVITCSNCAENSAILTIDQIINNKCKYCGEFLERNLDPYYLFKKYYNKEKPEEIPENCAQCDHYYQTSIFKGNKGDCAYFGYESTSGPEECIVTKFESHFGEIIESNECPNCGINQNEDALYCKDCGSEMYPKEYVKVAHCDKCDENFPIGNKFCETDGNELKIIEIEKVAEGQIVDVSSASKKEIKETSETVSADEVQEKKTELGFVWGNIWIALCFIQSIVFLILSFGLSPEESGLIVGFSFLTVTAFSSSVGLIKRKLWGLYITYFAIIVNYFICGIILFTTATELDINMPFSNMLLPSFIVGWLWLKYFNKRKEMFS